MNHINLPLTAQTAAPWSTVNAPMPNPMQKSAQDALDIMTRFVSESRIALRDAVRAFIFPQLGLLNEIHPMTQTKEGLMGYPIQDSVPEDNRMHVLMRVINGRLYNHMGQLDCYAWDMKTYLKNMRKAVPVGYNSEEAKKAMQDVLEEMTNEAEKTRLQQFMQLFAIDFHLVTTKPDWRQVVEVTQEMYDAGLTTIINDWENELSGWASTALQVGDFLVFTTAGMYTIRRDEFLQTHSTFIL